MDVNRLDVLRAKKDVLDALTSGEQLRLSLEAEAELGRRDTYYLCKHILGYEKLNTTFHRALCAAYDEHLYESQLHLHPRGHYKTTCLSVAGKTRLILLDPNVRILLLCNTVDNAEKILRIVRTHFTHNEKFRTLYPEHAPETKRQEGTSSYFTTPGRTKPWLSSHTIEAAGIDRALVSRHFDHGHFDDIVDNKNITTEDQRRKNYDGYTESLSLIDGKTPQNIPWVHHVGTRWHFDDTWGKLLAEQKECKTMYLLVTAAYKKRGDETVYLFPQEFPKEHLDYLRRTQRNFAALYLNNPVPEETAALNPAYMQFYTPDMLHGKLLNSCIAVDPSASYETSKGDVTFISLFSMDEDSNIYVREMRRGHWNPDEIVQQIGDVHRLFKVQDVCIETVAFQKWLCFYLEKAKVEQHLRIKIYPIRRNPHTTKHQRHERIVPFWRNNKIFFLKDDPLLPIATREAKEWPYGRLDDFIDTLTDGIEHLKPPHKRKQEGMLGRFPLQRYTSRNPIQTGLNY